MRLNARLKTIEIPSRRSLSMLVQAIWFFVCPFPYRLKDSFHRLIFRYNIRHKKHTYQQPKYRGRTEMIASRLRYFYFVRPNFSCGSLCERFFIHIITMEMCISFYGEARCGTLCVCDLCIGFAVIIYRYFSSSNQIYYYYYDYHMYEAIGLKYFQIKALVFFGRRDGMATLHGHLGSLFVFLATANFRAVIFQFTPSLGVHMLA